MGRRRKWQGRGGEGKTGKGRMYMPHPKQKSGHTTVLNKLMCNLLMYNVISSCLQTDYGRQYGGSTIGRHVKCA